MSSSIFRAFALLLCILLAPVTRAQSQEFGASARVIPDETSVRDRRGGAAELSFGLSQGVPWRAYTLANPDRLVLDFQEVDWTGLTPDSFASDAIRAVQYGVLRPGWSRFVAELSGPLGIETAALFVAPETATARLEIRLAELERETFNARTGAAPDARWVLPEPVMRAAPQTTRDRLVVMLDPGHGGIDPGAIRHGQSEADLILQLAFDIEEALLRAGGIDVVMTRRDDVFVSLEGRVAMARNSGAHLFISLHADALQEGVAHGASVYTLSETATDEATAALAERHERSDLLAGIDLSGSDDVVAQVLMDLARQDNAPRSTMLAKALIAGIEAEVGQVHKRPLRSAGFSVLKAPDIPSVLVEAGFLSTDEDLKNLQDPDWRSSMARGIRDGVLAWSLADAAVAPLRRK